MKLFQEEILTSVKGAREQLPTDTSVRTFLLFNFLTFLRS